MIKVNIEKDKEFKKVELLGHALYDISGKDIVCSAVSSIVTTTINGSLSIDSDSLKYEVSKDALVISDIKSDEVTQKLIENMVNLLKELESDYPENVKVIGG